MQKCKHDKCHCEGSDVRQDGYCSDACSQGQVSGSGCACGHPPCK